MWATAVLGFWEMVSLGIAAADLGTTLRREIGEMRGLKRREQANDWGICCLKRDDAVG